MEDKMEGIIHDTQTGLISTYKYNEKEIAEFAENKKQFETDLQNKEQIALEAKKAKQVLLDKLGITQDEAKLLLS